MSLFHPPHLFVYVFQINIVSLGSLAWYSFLFYFVDVVVHACFTHTMTLRFGGECDIVVTQLFDEYYHVCQKLTQNCFKNIFN